MKYLAIFLIGLFLVISLLVLNTIYPVLPSVANVVKNLSSSISDNWHNFLTGKQNEPAATTTVPAAIPTDLATEIQAEVDRAVNAKLAELSGGSRGGLVVVPANQASTSPEVIAQSFSDQVEVRPDASGQSGVIVPIFKNTSGQPYLYIMAPIRQ